MQLIILRSIHPPSLCKMIIVLNLKYCNILISKLLQKTVTEKKLFMFVFVFVFFCLLPKSLKLPSGLTKLRNHVILLMSKKQKYL